MHLHNNKKQKLRSKTWNSLVIHDKTHMCHYPATHVRWKQHTDEKKIVRLTWLAIVNTHLQKCSNNHNESSIFAYAGVKPQYGCVKPPSRSVYIYIYTIHRIYCLYSIFIFSAYTAFAASYSIYSIERIYRIYMDHDFLPSTKGLQTLWKLGLSEYGMVYLNPIVNHHSSTS